MKVYVVSYVNESESDTGYSTYYKTHVVGVFTSSMEAEQAAQRVGQLRKDVYPRIKEVNIGESELYG